MTKLNRLSLTEAYKGLKNKDFTSQEITQACLSEIDSQAELNAFIEVTGDKALDMAKDSDKNWQAGKARSLEGLPLAIKDLFCTKDVLSTSCSKILKDFRPSYESTVSQNLWNEGAVMLGKTNMDEFAMGSANITSCYGEVINPWKSKKSPEKKMVPGGSSGGSAAAVAGHLSLAATGSDTGGSIRQPASFCGLVGLKPTYGRCSRWGMIAFASSLDQAGPITKTVSDAALMMEAMASYDPKDSTSLQNDIPNFLENLTADLKGKRIGIPREYRLEGMSPEIDQLWNKGIELVKDAGAEIVDVSLPMTKYALPTYYIVAPAEASSNLARYDGVRYGLRVEGKDLNDMYVKTRAEGFGEEVKRRILIGTYVLSAGYYDAYYVKAQKVRRLIAEDFDRAFQKVDALLTPSTPSEAFAIGAKLDPLTMYLNDVFTVPASLAGLPGISVPASLTHNGLPLGLQVIGRPLDEQMVLNIGKAIEDRAGFQAI